jgi:peptidoglycan/LPS O-acetylase OafA/YrhL
MTKIEEKRFVLVDALRGIAAFAVLCHHLLFNSSLQVTLWTVFPGWFAEFCHMGAYGVQIFFVLSGFVIAHSLRNVPLTPRGMGNFMLRRQLRLDLPYWTILALTLVSLVFENHFSWIEHKAMPGIGAILLNMFYLQNIFGGDQITGVAWTLCLEVQFYILFIVLLSAGKAMGRTPDRTRAVQAALVGVVGIVSLLLPRETAHTGIIQWWTFAAVSPWFIEWWFYFAAGVLCYWAVSTAWLRPWLYGFLGLFAVLSVIQEPRQMFTGWTTAVLLYTAGRMGKLTVWLNWAPLQYLGRISYSLYLSHLLVAVYVLRFGYRLTHTNGPAAIGWFILAGLVAVGAAHLLYLSVERTSVAFAARLKPAAPKANGIPMQPLSGEIKSLQSV